MTAAVFHVEHKRDRGGHVIKMTPDDLDLIKRLWGKEPQSKIAMRIGVTTQAVSLRGRAMGLPILTENRGKKSSLKNETPFGRRLREVITIHGIKRHPIEKALGIRYGELSSYICGNVSASAPRMLAIVDALPEISEEERLSLHWAAAVTLGFELGPDPTPRPGDFQI